ncbi:DNA/RNA nuclease SfsA [Myxococcota bacterium]|nr:DNA/RNA nuclease SfsA [Myxococcota bacterium]MBU1509841.1 DNA/RNA nuclease SfsA [Myxococcota bacterium]
MNLGELQEGLLLGRRQRFFADVRLGDNEVVAHCANTGSMRSLLLPGTRALISRAANPARKLAWDLQLLRLPGVPKDGPGVPGGGTGTLACVNTQLPNRIVAEALAQGLIPGIPVGAQVKPEAVAGPGTRLDFRVEVPGQGACWIEVKNVTLVEPDLPGVARFPDAVSERGLKHLRTLVALRAAGDRAVILYLVNRTDATSFAPAAHLDPAYARGLADALSAGVEALVCFTEILQIDGAWHVRVARVERHIP